MDDRTAGTLPRTKPGVTAEPERRPRPRGVGLSWKLLLLTVLFVMGSALLIYVPSITNFHVNWLADRLARADTASVALAGAEAAEVPRSVQDELLEAIGATAIAIRDGDVSRLVATVDMPPEIGRTVDLRTMEPAREVLDAFDTLLTPSERMMRVVGMGRNGQKIEIVISDRPLRAAMLRFSVGVLWLSALTSVALAALLYFSLDRMFVRPMRRLTDNMVSFSEAPQDPGRVIEPSGRSDEIGIAEEHLAGMQRELQETLSGQQHLVDLGLAVSKINHDLRNMLASAQLISDRLGSLPDPSVQRFAPKLIAALDRAIAYCQTTLAYGRAREAPPARRLIALARLVEEVGEALGLAGHPAIAFENAVPPGLEVDADPDQLFRILVNLCRNAVQALDGDQDPAVVRRLTVSARRDAAAVTIVVDDTGPGVPEKARAHLFQAFQGAARPGGTGLGLAIAAELVAAHGGRISLLDKAGPGARFEIVLPQRPANGGTGRSPGG